MTTDRRPFSWRRAALWAIQASIVVGLLWLVFRKIDISELGSAFRSANKWLLVLGIILLIVERIIRPYRLAVLLDKREQKLSIIGLQSASQLVNLVLPMRPGEFFLIFALQRIGYSSASFALSVVAIDRLFDVMCCLLIFVLSIAAVAKLPGYTDNAALLLTGATVIIMGVIIAIVVARPAVLAAAQKLLLRWASPGQAPSWRHRLEQLIDGFAILFLPHRVLPAIIITICAWGTAVLAAWLILSSVWAEATLYAASLAVCLGGIGITLVSVPAGIGVLHAAFALGALVCGASQEAAVVFAILEHFLSVVATAAIGLMGLPIVRKAGLTLAISTKVR
jgi:uncharacterized protein (TIRG00374 family)